MPEARIQTEWISGFGRGLWRYVRPRFFTAGQDSFSDPPSQNEDNFELLLNVMPPVQGDFDRRWGYRAFNTAATHGASTAQRAYPSALWSDDPPTTRNYVAADSNGLTAFLEGGSTPTTVAHFAGVPRAYSSRGWLYATDGISTPKAWNGITNNTLRNWGIDINSGSAAVGPNNPATASGSWTNGNNIFTQDGLVASSTRAAQAIDFGSFSLVILANGNETASNFGFGLASTTTIVGIQVDVYVTSIVDGGGGDVPVGNGNFLNVLLKKAGLSVGLPRETPRNIPVGTVNAYYSLGGPSDLWGTNWSAADINNSGFGAVITPYVPYGPTGGVHTCNAVTWNIDHVRITVYTKASALSVGSPTAGSVTLISGRQYFYVFYNSTALHYSDLSPVSVSTGPVTNKQIPLSGIAVSSDPQVDRKLVLATADGGDQTVLFQLADIPNATTTFTDNTPETTLLLANQWVSAQDDGSVVGVVDNTPPPPGLQFPLLHRGRMYGLVGSNLYFSKSNDELLTATGVLAGRFEESFPALNFFPITNTAEQGRGLLSDGTVLYIGTDKRIVRLFGDGPQTFLKPEPLFDNVGILNQDVWKLILIEGNPVGAMWLTPDYRVIGADFNTYQDIGVPVQNILDSINRTSARDTAWAAYVGISIFNLYVLAVPTGTNIQPDTLLVFDIKGKRWYQWQTTDTLVGGFWWVTLGGQPQFVVQAATGKFYAFDPTVFQDRVGDTPVNYTATMRTSWLALGDETARKHLNEIEVATGDPAMTVTVEGASTVAKFSAPNVVVSAAPLVVKPLGEFGVFLGSFNTRDKWYRFTFSASDQATDLLRSYNIQGHYLHRI